MPLKTFPIHPSFTIFRAVWSPAPRKVSGAQQQPFFHGKVDHFFGILEMDCQRFFAMHVFAVIERRKADLSSANFLQL